MGKSVWVQGARELEKLEKSCGRVKFQFVVPNAKVVAGRYY